MNLENNEYNLSLKSVKNIYKTIVNEVLSDSNLGIEVNIKPMTYIEYYRSDTLKFILKLNHILKKILLTKKRLNSRIKSLDEALILLNIREQNILSMQSSIILDNDIEPKKTK